MFIQKLEEQKNVRPFNYSYLSRLLKVVNHYKANPMTGGVKHHILPKNKSWFPEYRRNKENLLYVSVRVHFLIHHLMWKAFPKDPAMYTAFWNMSHFHKDLRLTSKQYEHIRNVHSENMRRDNPAKRAGAMDSCRGENNPAKRPEVREKIRQSKLGHVVPMEQREAQRKKMLGRYAGEKNPSKRQEVKDKISKILTGIAKPKIQCPHCGKVVGGHANYLRWHGDKCKSLL